MKRALLVFLLSLVPLGAGAEPGGLAVTPYHGRPASIGSAANGCLSGGVAMPISGPGWEVLRPDRNRFWGNPALISFLLEKVKETRKLGTILIADIAQPRGGHMVFGHGSHQTGVDVDILFHLADGPIPADQRADPHLDGLVMVTPEGRTDPEKWGASQRALVKIFAKDPRVERIFVNPVIKRALCETAGSDRDWLRRVRPWWGHQEHFHVRLKCPANSPRCIPGPALPPGDGCGAELRSWIDSGDWKAEPHPPPGPQPVYRRTMPAACRTILGAP